MDELVGRLVAAAGISEQTARRAVEIIIGFLKDAGPPDKVAELLAKLPGAEAIESPGGFGGMMGAMAAFNALNNAGLDMGEIQTVTRELVAFARQHAGSQLVDDVVGSIPGLGQFV
ncbi:hypothetical protein EDC22_11610 [Tepidamorphus gemmatus]|uniref:DUF2267 domain-containing protein n=1 Tax=Tepidamorphus gemmatus TaxID=747076 RepID=A0A4R3LUF7_9HYPH|nr:DUF2267 domain-containing protein [Tepidamorphus gemmatus]TCT04134.1 hypothetical protein EDC22_11610 [Tepidamorphus gemmatus]